MIKYFLRFLLRYYKFTLVIIIILLLNIFYNKNYLNIKRGLDYNLINYERGNKIFIDRNYLDQNKSKTLDNKILIQTNRHNKDNIYILNLANLEVYRPSCKQNNNKEYNNWDILQEKI